MHPIISALKHHRTAVILMVLEVALAGAIVTNALFVIATHLRAMQVTTGVADRELVWLRSSGLRDDLTPAGRASLAAADLAALRAMPGVKDVSMANSLPLSGSVWRWAVYGKSGDERSIVDNVSIYVATPGLVRTLGLQLVEGRDFLPQEYSGGRIFSDDPPPPAVIVTRQFADKMWPGVDPIGKPIYLGEKGKDVTHVVGVLAHLLNAGLDKFSDDETNIMLPYTSVQGGLYVIRTSPAMRDVTLREVPKVLDRVDDQRIITEVHTLSETIDEHFHDDRALIWLLLAVIGCLLALTALGVVGLSSFWVQQRTRQIGIRRAIGATRRDILVYFQTENLLIVTAGIVLGSFGAVALNLWLMAHYELPRMSLAVLPIGALVLWLIGQLAALGPALRASRVPPVVATRSV
ncbi:ABC transporter permease [Dyella ginsengisoli]|uniref:ABC transporter permease n=1 Tax=Dyella ginsengisoli TaxID=363848 RepID=A0ABW8JSC1_9GAMM